MAFTRKGKRRIVVDGHLLYWSATGNDGWISLSVMSDCEEGGKVFASFDYHHVLVPITVNGHECISGTDQFVITPYIVRQVAQLAFAQGWKPQEKGNNLRLGHVDDRVDLRLHKNRMSCFKESR